MRAAENSVVGWRRDLAWAVVAALIVLATSAAGGFRAMKGNGDNDSLLRLVQVRDLLAGQGWFDMHQYRMGPEGGFIMHWSRLVDAPLAGLIQGAEALGLSVSAAERFAKIAWPTLTCGLTIFFLVRATRRFSTDDVGLPAVVVATAGLFFLAVYEPGNIDHHNVQLMLVAGSLHFLLAAPNWRPAAALSGACAALTLAIGMETAPLVAAIGLCVAGIFFFQGDREANTAVGFGLGFATIPAAVFLSTIGPSAWGTAACDAFSVVQFALATVAGLGLVLAASITPLRSSRLRRLVMLGLLGAVGGAVALLFFPQCLRSPFADLDPRLRALWLDNVSEAQSLFQLATGNPTVVVATYVTPLIALVLLMRRLLSGDRRREVLIVAMLLSAAFAISVWQVRGANFSIAIAVIPLAAWVASWRSYATAIPSTKATIAMIAVWLVSLNGVWSVSAATISMLTDGKANPIADSISYTCANPGDYEMLAAQPVTTVLTVSNLGSPILVYTGHRVLAGPYHRNVEGNLLVIDALMGSAMAAEKIIRDQHVGLIALCRSDAETKSFSDIAPDGFLAALIKGQPPAWLEPVPGTTGKPIELYRVKPG